MRKYNTEKCPTCKQKTETVICYCDTCKKQLDYDGWNKYGNTNYLQLVLTDHFDYEPSECDTKDFCSWKCLFEWMKKNSLGYDEIELPPISNEHIGDFMKEIRKEKE